MPGVTRWSWHEPLERSSASTSRRRHRSSRRVAGRRIALVDDAAPDVLFSTAGEAEAFLGGYDFSGLLGAAPLAIVKRGAGGATILARGDPAPLRFDVATPAMTATDTTGAGDAFDAGFLVAFLAEPPASRVRPAALRRAALAGHRAATRQLASGSPELSLR
jgi:sugar/nucleoside kinase (ribokinase family)